MSLESVRAFFAEHAPDVAVMVSPKSSATVALAAEAFGVEPGRIAKTLSLRVGDRELVMRLQYRVEGDIIVTTQEGAVEEIRTKFVFPDHDTLVLEHSGEKFTFRRVLA